MADPTKYVPGYSYSDWQESNPAKPLPAPETDNDFAEIAQSIDETIDALKDIRRSDGHLNNGIVELESASDDFKQWIINEATHDGAQQALDAAAAAAASAALADADAVATAADRLQTGLDLEATTAARADAALFEQGAEDAAEIAIAARDAALAFANVQPDIATGLASVADGELFAVAGAIGSYIAATLYRRDSVSTYTLITQLPSLGILDPSTIRYFDGQQVYFEMPSSQSGGLSPMVITIDGMTYVVGMKLPDGSLITSETARYIDAKKVSIDVSGSSGPSAFVVAEDGTGYLGGLVLPGGNIIEQSPTRYYNGASVLLEVAGTNDRSPLLIGDDGTTYVADLHATNSATTQKNIVCIGDSLTAGAGGTPYPTQLGVLLPERTVINLGIGGQWGNQIAGRQGGRAFGVTISGGALSSGSNTVTHFDGVAIATMAASPGAPQLLSTASDNVTRTVKVVVAGIVCTLQRMASGGPPSTSETYTLTPDGGQVLPVIVSANTPMVLYNAPYDDDVHIFWPDRNSDWSQPDVIDADLAAMVARLGHKKSVAMSVLNGNYANEYIGQSRHTQMLEINRRRAKAYPANYLDIRSILVAQGASGAPYEDATSYGNDIPPSGLRSDNIHLNTAGYAIVASAVRNFILLKGW